MSWSEVLLFLHLVSFGALLAGVGVAATGGIKACTSAVPKDILTFCGLTKIGGTIIGPSTIVLLITGLALVERQGLEFDEPWIIASVALWIVAFGLGHMQKRHFKSMAMLAAGEVASPTPSPELQALVANKGPEIRGTLLNLIVVVFVALMVFKPGA